MARKAKTQVENKFMLVWHDKPATMFVTSPHPDRFADLTIPSGAKVAISDYEEWVRVPHFSRDVNAGVLHVEPSDTVPQIKNHIIPESWGLNANQIFVAQVICSTDPLTPQLTENIELHKLLGTSGVPRQGVKVTKPWLIKSHRPFLQATLELEISWKNRPTVTKMLSDAIEAIGVM